MVEAVPPPRLQAEEPRQIFRAPALQVGGRGQAPVGAPRCLREGEADPKLGPIFDGLTIDSAPHEFFRRIDAPDSEYGDIATNSQL